MVYLTMLVRRFRPLLIEPNKRERLLLYLLIVIVLVYFLDTYFFITYDRFINRTYIYICNCRRCVIVF